MIDSLQDSQTGPQKMLVPWSIPRYSGPNIYGKPDSGTGMHDMLRFVILAKRLD
jgi:hypothetical protein